MKRTHLFFLILMLVFSLAASGCLSGSDDDDNSDGDQSEDGDDDAVDGDTETPDGDDDAVDGDTEAPDGDDDAVDGDTEAPDGDDDAVDGDTETPDGDDDAVDGDTETPDGDDDAVDGDTETPDGDDDAVEDDTEVADIEAADGEGTTATLSNVSNSECLTNRDDVVESFEAAYDANTGTVTAIHHNVEFNCCLDTVDVQMQISGTTIQLYESETVTTPCDCICPYDVTSEIDDLEPGGYTVEFYKGGTLAGSANVTVSEEARILSTEDSGCLDTSRLDTEPVSSFEAAYDSETGNVEVIHRNAMFNCCLDEIAVEMTLDGNTIKLKEAEVAPNPCFCTCPYDVTTTIGSLEDGLYTVEFYNDSNQLQGSANVAVGVSSRSANSECLGLTRTEEVEELVLSFEEGVLTASHRRATYNCCIDHIAVSMEIDGTDIDLVETEVLDMPCNCVCPFNVDTRIFGLTAGTYTVNVFAFGSLWQSKNITIP